MGKSGNFCPGLRLALTLKRVPAGPKIASFLAKNAHSWRTSSPRSLLTENGRISKPKTSSLVETLLENSRLEIGGEKLSLRNSHGRKVISWSKSNLMEKVISWSKYGLNVATKERKGAIRNKSGAFLIVTYCLLLSPKMAFLYIRMIRWGHAMTGAINK